MHVCVSVIPSELPAAFSNDQCVCPSVLPAAFRNDPQEKTAVAKYLHASIIMSNNKVDITIL